MAISRKKFLSLGWFLVFSIMNFSALTEAAIPRLTPLCPVQLEPGKRLGPIQIGMTRDELSSLGLPIRIEESDSDYLSKNETTYTKAAVGPFWVTLEAGRVTQIRSSVSTSRELLPECLQVNRTEISLNEKRKAVEILKKSYSGCSASETGDGIRCKEGLSILWNRESADLRVGL